MVPLTCSASPGGKFSDLVPPVLFEVIAFHAADRLGGLATNHNHDLQKDKQTLAGSPQLMEICVINPWSFTCQLPGVHDLTCHLTELHTWRCYPPNHQQTGRFKKVGKDILPQKHHHEVYISYIPILWDMLVVRVDRYSGHDLQSC